MALLEVQQIAAVHFYIREEFSFLGPFALGKPLFLRATGILVRSVSQVLRRQNQRTGVQMILEHTGESGSHSLASCLVGGNRINSNAGNGFVAERLLDDGQIDVRFHKRNAARVLQAVKMALVLG